MAATHNAYSEEVAEESSEVWVECYDEVSNSVYYVDKANAKRSTWTRPAHGTIIPFEALAAEEAASAASASDGPAASAGPSVSLGPTAKTLGNTWVQLFDPQSNHAYFANALTKRTTWTRPTGADAIIIAAEMLQPTREEGPQTSMLDNSSGTFNDRSIDDVFGRSTVEVSNSGEDESGFGHRDSSSLSPRVRRSGSSPLGSRNTNSTAESSSGTVETSSRPDFDLPTFQDESGVTYFIDPVSGGVSRTPVLSFPNSVNVSPENAMLQETTYSFPFEPSARSHRDRGGSVSPKTRDHEPHSRENVWRQQLDSISQKRYFVNDSTGVTTWIDPADEHGSDVELAGEYSSESDSGNCSTLVGEDANRDGDAATAVTADIDGGSGNGGGSGGGGGGGDGGRADRKARPMAIRRLSSSITDESGAGSPGREEIWEVDVRNLDGTLVKDISEIKDFGINSLAKYMKTAATLLKKGRSVHTLRKALRNIIEIAEHPTPETWEKIKSTIFIRWLLMVLANHTVKDAWPETLTLLHLMAEQEDSRYLLVRESRLWDMMFQSFLAQAATVADRSTMARCILLVLKILRRFLQEDHDIFCFFVYQSDGVGLFLDIQKRLASPVMTRVIERILLRSFKGPPRENSLLMRLSANRLFSVLQSNMMRLVPKVLRALRHRLEMYHLPMFSSLVVSQQTLTTFSSLDFGVTWNKRHIVLSPNGFLFEYDIVSRGQTLYVPLDSCAVFKVDLKSVVAAEIAINRINGVHHYGLQLASLDPANDRTYTLAIARSDQMQEWLKICQEVSRSNWRLSASSSYNRGVLLANAHLSNALGSDKQDTAAHPLTPARFFIRSQPSPTASIKGTSDRRGRPVDTGSPMQGRHRRTGSSRGVSAPFDEEDPTARFFNIDESQSISPDVFDATVQLHSTHGGGFVDLLCTYIDIIDAESNHECETAMAAFEILALYISGNNAAKHSKTVLRKGVDCVSKVFRALRVALPHLSRFGCAGNASKSEIDVENMGCVLYPPLQKSVHTDTFDSDIPNEIAWEVELDEHLAHDLGVSHESSSTKSQSEESGRNLLRSPRKDGHRGHRKSAKQSRRSDASDFSATSAHSDMGFAAGISLAHFLASSAAKFLIGLLMPHSKALALSRFSREDCVTLVELVSCRDADILTLACHVLQTCVSSSHGHTVRRHLHGAGFISALCQIRFPESLLNTTLPTDKLVDGKSSRSLSDPLAEPGVRSSTSHESRESVLKMKIRRFQISLLRRNLAIMFLVCQRKRALHLDATTLTFILESDIAPAVLVALRVVGSRCNSMTWAGEVSDLLVYGVPKIGALIEASVRHAADPLQLPPPSFMGTSTLPGSSTSPIQLTSLPPTGATSTHLLSEHQRVISAMECKTRFTAAAVLFALVSNSSTEQRQVYCEAGIVSKLIALISQDSDFADGKISSLTFKVFSFEHRLVRKTLDDLRGSLDDSGLNLVKLGLDNCFSSDRHLSTVAACTLLLLLHRSPETMRSYLMVPDGNVLVFELLQCLQNPYVVPQTKTIILVLLRTAAAHSNASNEHIIGDIGGIEVIFSQLRSTRSWEPGVSGLRSPKGGGGKARVVTGQNPADTAIRHARNSSGSAVSAAGADARKQRLSGGRSPGNKAGAQQQCAIAVSRLAGLALLEQLCTSCPENSKRARAPRHAALLFEMARFIPVDEAEVALRLICQLFGTEAHGAFSCTFGKYLIGVNPGGQTLVGDTFANGRLGSAPRRSRRKVSHVSTAGEPRHRLRAPCFFLPLLVQQANSRQLGLASASMEQLQMLGSIHYFLHGYGRSPAGTEFVLFGADDLHTLVGVEEAIPSQAKSESDRSAGPWQSTLVENDVRRNALATLLLRFVIGQWPTLGGVQDFRFDAAAVPIELRLASLGRGNQFSTWRTMRFVLKLVIVDGVTPMLVLYGYKRRASAQHLRRLRARRLRQAPSSRSAQSETAPANDLTGERHFTNENLDPDFKLLIHCPAFGIRCEIQTRSQKVLGAGVGSRFTGSQTPAPNQTVLHVALLKIDRFICNERIAYANRHPQFRNFVFAFKAPSETALTTWLNNPRWRFCARVDVEPGAGAEYFDMLDRKFCSSPRAVRTKIVSQSPENRGGFSARREMFDGADSSSEPVSSANARILARSGEERYEHRSQYFSDPAWSSDSDTILGPSHSEAEGPVSDCTFTDVTTDDAELGEEEELLNGDLEAGDYTSKHVDPVVSMRNRYYNFEWSVQSALSVGNTTDTRGPQSPSAELDRVFLSGAFATSSASPIGRGGAERVQAGIGARANSGNAVSELTEFSLRAISDYAIPWTHVTAKHVQSLCDVVSWDTAIDNIALVVQSLEVILSHLPAQLWNVRDSGDRQCLTGSATSPPWANGNCDRHERLTSRSNRLRADADCSSGSEVSGSRLRASVLWQRNDFRRSAGSTASVASAESGGSGRHSLLSSTPRSVNEHGETSTSRPVSQSETTSAGVHNGKVQCGALHHKLVWVEQFDEDEIVAALMRAVKMLFYCGNSAATTRLRCDFLAQCSLHALSPVSLRAKTITHEAQELHPLFQPPPLQIPAEVCPSLPDTAGLDTFPPGLCYEIRVPVLEANVLRPEGGDELAGLLLRRSASVRRDPFTPNQLQSSQIPGSETQNHSYFYWSMLGLQRVPVDTEAKGISQLKACTGDRLVRIGRYPIPINCSPTAVQKMWVLAYNAARARLECRARLPTVQTFGPVDNSAYLSLVFVREKVTGSRSVEGEYEAPRDCEMKRVQSMISTRHCVAKVLSHVCSCLFRDDDRSRYFYGFYDVCRKYLIQHKESAHHVAQLCVAPDRGHVGCAGFDFVAPDSLLQTQMATVLSVLQFICRMCENSDSGSYTILTSENVAGPDGTAGEKAKRRERQAVRNLSRNSSWKMSSSTPSTPGEQSPHVASQKRPNSVMSGRSTHVPRTTASPETPSWSDASPVNLLGATNSRSTRPCPGTSQGPEQDVEAAFDSSRITAELIDIFIDAGLVANSIDSLLRWAQSPQFSKAENFETNIHDSQPAWQTSGKGEGQHPPRPSVATCTASACRASTESRSELLLHVAHVFFYVCKFCSLATKRKLVDQGLVAHLLQLRSYFLSEDSKVIFGSQNYVRIELFADASAHLARVLEAGEFEPQRWRVLSTGRATFQSAAVKSQGDLLATSCLDLFLDDACFSETLVSFEQLMRILDASLQNSEAASEACFAATGRVVVAIDDHLAPVLQETISRLLQSDIWTSDYRKAQAVGDHPSAAEVDGGAVGDATMATTHQVLSFLRSLFDYLVAHCSYFHLQFFPKEESASSHGRSQSASAVPDALPILTPKAKRTFRAVHRVCTTAASLLRNLMLQGRAMCQLLQQVDIRPMCFTILRFSAVRDGSMSEDVLFALYGSYIVDETHGHALFLQDLQFRFVASSMDNTQNPRSSPRVDNADPGIHSPYVAVPVPHPDGGQSERKFSARMRSYRAATFKTIDLFLSITASVSPGVMELCAQIFERITVTIGRQDAAEAQVPSAPSVHTPNGACIPGSESERQLMEIAKRLVGWVFFVPVAHLRQARNSVSRLRAGSKVAANAARPVSHASTAPGSEMYVRYANAISSICAALANVCTVSTKLVECIASQPDFFSRLTAVLELRDSDTNSQVQSTGGIYEQVCRLLLPLSKSDYVQVHEISSCVRCLGRLCVIAHEQPPGSVQKAVIDLLLSLLGFADGRSMSSIRTQHAGTRGQKCCDEADELCDDSAGRDPVFTACDFETLMAMVRLVHLRRCRLVVWHAAAQLANRLEWQLHPTAASMTMVDKCGWLLRRTSSNVILGPKWLRRWFVIRTPHLFEFLGRDGKKAAVLKRKILLAGCAVTKVSEGGRQALQLRIRNVDGALVVSRSEVQATADGGRNGHGIDSEMDDWFDEIRDAIIRANQLTGQQSMFSLISQLTSNGLIEAPGSKAIPSVIDSAGGNFKSFTNPMASLRVRPQAAPQPLKQPRHSNLVRRGPSFASIRTNAVEVGALHDTSPTPSSRTRGTPPRPIHRNAVEEPSNRPRSQAVRIDHNAFQHSGDVGSLSTPPPARKRFNLQLDGAQTNPERGHFRSLSQPMANADVCASAHQRAPSESESGDDSSVSAGTDRRGRSRTRSFSGPGANSGGNPQRVRSLSRHSARTHSRSNSQRNGALLLNMDEQSSISSKDFIELGYVKYVAHAVQQVAIAVGLHGTTNSNSIPSSTHASGTGVLLTKGGTMPKIALELARILAVLLPQIAGEATAAGAALVQELAGHCAVASVIAATSFAPSHIQAASTSEYQRRLDRTRLLNALAIARAHVGPRDLVVDGVNCLFPHFDLPIVDVVKAMTQRVVSCAMCSGEFTGFYRAAADGAEGAGYLLPPCQCFASQFDIKSTCAQCASSFDPRLNNKVPCSYCKSACCKNCCNLAVMQLGEQVSGGVVVNVCVHCYRVSRHIRLPTLETCIQSALFRKKSFTHAQSSGQEREAERPPNLQLRQPRATV